MKIIKYLFIFVLIAGLGISAWFYYPQYKLHQLQNHAVETSKGSAGVSYINYFKLSKHGQLNHLAIGDSVIRGTGAPENENLVSQFSAMLENQTHKKIVFENEGINGITSNELNNLVQEGRFDGEIRKADIVTINVGGNDILKMAKGQNFQTVFQAFDRLQTDFSKNLADIAARVHQLNPKTTIIFLELYNPLPPSNQMYSLADKLLPNWNLKIYEVANQYPSSIVVETTKAINGNHPQNLSPDGIHPNAAGYAAISEQMMYQIKHQYRKESV